jgi:rare lipoprotein A
VQARFLHRAEGMWPTTRAVRRSLLPGMLVLVSTTACVGRHPAPTPASRAVRSEQAGYATYLARSFHGKTSASGETFDERRMVAAHRTLPFGSVVRVTNVRNGRSVTVRIIDRGPYGKNYREGTVIDVSRAAAHRLRMIRDGQVPARVELLTLGGAL